MFWGIGSDYSAKYFFNTLSTLGYQSVISTSPKCKRLHGIAIFLQPFLFHHIGFFGNFASSTLLKDKGLQSDKIQ